MKTRIVKEKYSVKDLRPYAEYNKYIELVQSDIENIFKNHAGVYIKECPACKHPEAFFEVLAENY